MDRKNLLVLLYCSFIIGIVARILKKGKRKNINLLSGMTEKARIIVAIAAMIKTQIATRWFRLIPDDFTEKYMPNGSKMKK